MNINAKISGRIIVLMSNYMKATGADKATSLVWAFNQVLGAGAYESMASEVYDAMQVSAA